ncbi:MAG: ABC transporter ATP-binding protein [Chloroflexi bacterium]|nr:ABC transporter ATP-binding protein [Chloroflexota bacterium]
MSKKQLESQNALERRYQGENPFRTLLYLYSGQKSRLTVAAIFFAIKQSPVWVMPLITANIIDIVSRGGPNTLGSLWFNAMILAILLVQNIPTHYLYVRSLSLAARTMETRLRSAIVHQLQHLSIGYYKNHSPGRLQSKVMRDVEAIEQLTRLLYDGGLGAILSMTFAIITTAIRAPIFLIVFVVSVPIAATILRSLRGALAERNSAFRIELERMSARVLEMTNLIPITRAHGLEENEIERVDQTFLNVRQAGLELDYTTAFFNATSWVTFNMFNMGCLVFTSWAHFSGFIPITIGDIVLLTGYFNSLTSSVMNLANMVPQISKGFESIRSIGEVLESPDLEQNEGKQEVTSVKGELSFENVLFRYSDSDEDAIRNFSLHVEAGETIALVGASGSGKTTILNLVIGFIRPTSGRILIDGVDMGSLDLRTYRRFLSVVPQETILFDGTVRENITYGLKSVSDKTVETALGDANAMEFVQDLADGLNTGVGEKGARLSGGQKQRLSIARALIRNPRVLILDEATSALDTESEALIQEALERLMHNRTTFVVAHRLSTIRNAKRIVVMKRGRIVEIGSHEELLKKDGAYARLYARQAH